MKAIESFSVSESFGLKDLSLEEIENINGGASIGVGSCGKIESVGISALNGGTLSGAVGPSGPGPISSGGGSGSSGK